MYIMWLIDQLRILYQLQYPYPYLAGTPSPADWMNMHTLEILNIAMYDLNVLQINELIKRYFGEKADDLFYGEEL